MTAETLAPDVLRSVFGACPSGVVAVCGTVIMGLNARQSPTMGVIKAIALVLNGFSAAWWLLLSMYAT